jgi:hypothetical protein
MKKNVATGTLLQHQYYGVKLVTSESSERSSSIYTGHTSNWHNPCRLGF